MVQELSDPRRVDPPFVAVERTMLEAWLDYHRVTLLVKCEGLADVDRKARPVSTSKLSLHGLVRHMAEVERSWFQTGTAPAPRHADALVRPSDRRSTPATTAMPTSSGS